MLLPWLRVLDNVLLGARLRGERRSPALAGRARFLLSQVGLAQMIRRLRDLGMPLDEVRTILQAPDASTRDATLIAHLQRMEEQLAQTQQTVASLRTLLQQQPDGLQVERRPIPATTALAITETVDAAEAAFQLDLHCWSWKCRRSNPAQRLNRQRVAIDLAN